MLEIPEARAKLRRKLETWPDDRKSPVTINQGLELLDLVERLEKEANWLATELANKTFQDKEEGVLPYLSKDGGKIWWRSLAKEQVEER